MPYIQELYEKYSQPDSDVAILGVAFPNMGKETSIDGISKFLEDVIDQARK